MDYEDEDGNPWPSWAFYMNLHPNDSLLVYSEPLANDTAFIAVSFNSGAAQMDVNALSFFSGYLVA